MWLYAMLTLWLLVKSAPHDEVLARRLARTRGLTKVRISAVVRLPGNGWHVNCADTRTAGNDAFIVIMKHKSGGLRLRTTLDSMGREDVSDAPTCPYLVTRMVCSWYAATQTIATHVHAATPQHTEVLILVRVGKLRARHAGFCGAMKRAGMRRSVCPCHSLYTKSAPGVHFRPLCDTPT